MCLMPHILYFLVSATTRQQQTPKTHTHNGDNNNNQPKCVKWRERSPITAIELYGILFDVRTRGDHALRKVQRHVMQCCLTRLYMTDVVVVRQADAGNQRLDGMPSDNTSLSFSLSHTAQQANSGHPNNNKWPNWHGYVWRFYGSKLKLKPVLSAMYVSHTQNPMPIAANSHRCLTNVGDIFLRSHPYGAKLQFPG